MMYKKLGLVLAVAAGVVGTCGAGPASAKCPVDDPDCGVPQTTSTVLSVTRSAGVVSGPGISCGADCTQGFTFPVGDGGPSVDLQASGGPAGSAPVWSGCDSAAGDWCTVDMSFDQSVSLTWKDVTAPSVGSVVHPAKMRDQMLVQAAASDNSGTVAKVEFRED